MNSAFKAFYGSRLFIVKLSVFHKLKPAHPISSVVRCRIKVHWKVLTISVFFLYPAVIKRKIKDFSEGDWKVPNAPKSGKTGGIFFSLIRFLAG